MASSIWKKGFRAGYAAGIHGKYGKRPRKIYRRKKAKKRARKGGVKRRYYS